MFAKQLVNHKEPGSPCWTSRGTRSQNPSCERRGPAWLHSLNPISHDLSSSILCPFPSCRFRAWRAPRLISSGPRALLTIPYRVPRWGSLVHWKQSDTDGVFGPRDKAESSSWEKRITLNLGGKKKKAYKDEQEAKYVAGSFHGFRNLFSSPFLITSLPNSSVIHLLIIPSLISHRWKCGNC